MATASQTKNLFNNQYRIRPTTVDQKRILPRSKDKKGSTSQSSLTDRPTVDRAKTYMGHTKLSTSQKKLHKDNKLSTDSQKNISFVSNDSDDEQSNSHDYNQSFSSITASPQPHQTKNRHNYHNGSSNDHTADDSNIITEDNEDDQTSNDDNANIKNSFSDIESEFDDEILNDDRWDTDIEGEGMF